MIDVFNYDGFEICDGVISRGVARLYFESGFPLAEAAQFAKENGLQISWLNVARQLLQQGFKAETVISEFKDLPPGEIDIEQIKTFVLLDDEAQKEMLWEFWNKTPQFAAMVATYER
jgi:hypothetical protein